METSNSTCLDLANQLAHTHGIYNRATISILMLTIPFLAFIVIVGATAFGIKAKYKTVVHHHFTNEEASNNQRTRTTTMMTEKAKPYYLNKEVHARTVFYQKQYTYEKQYQILYLCFALSLFYSFAGFIIWWPSIAITLGVDIAGVGTLALLISCIDPSGDCFSVNANCSKSLFHLLFYIIVCGIQQLWSIYEVSILSVVTYLTITFKHQLEITLGQPISTLCINKEELLKLLRIVFPGSSVSAQLIYSKYGLLSIGMLCACIVLIGIKISFSLKLVYGKTLAYFKHKINARK